LPVFLKLAYLPSPGKVRLRLSARGTNKEVLENALEQYVKSLDAIIHDIIVGFEEDETIEFQVGKMLKQQQKTLATAESCTGGKIAAVLTSIPGASEYFKGSVVSYATEAKIAVLGVPESMIKEFSVVSEAVVSAMASRTRQIMNTDYAIATSGNAGPTKGDDNAEIGTVFIALATPDDVIVEKYNFGQPRDKVIDSAVIKSLELLKREIFKIVQ
jgi:nicotinamide-nucleotide amidase